MLVATPLHQHIEHSKPRVISEIKKVAPKSSLDHLQPRISGELFYYNNESSKSSWCRRHVQIRGGVLLVSTGPYNGDVAFRVALRHLNLRPGSEPKTFALYSRGCDDEPIATFQAATQREYDIWVKIISIELMRQTPLEAIKYLDIMGLAPSPSEANISLNASSISNRSRRSSSSDRSSCSSDSVTSPTLTKRRCRSELRLNIANSLKEDLKNTKDLVKICSNSSNASTTSSISSSSSSSSSSEEDFNSNRTTSTCVDCQSKNKRNVKKSLFQNNDLGACDTIDGIGRTNSNILYNASPILNINNNNNNSLDVNKNFAIYEFQKRQARERIRRVLSLKQATQQQQSQSHQSISTTVTPVIPLTPSTPLLKKYDIGSSLSYSRVYNVREGIQLKSYDLKNLKTPNHTPVERISSTATKKESTKLDMLRKNTNTLVENNKNVGKKDFNFILTDYKSTRLPEIQKSKSDDICPAKKTHEFLHDKNSADRFLVSSHNPPLVTTDQTNHSDEETVEILLKKCQNSDSYVPVKDKLILFESLCRLGRRLAKSNEDLASIPNNVTQHKRARSMHDLNSCGVGVREICKYFETKTGAPNETTNTVIPVTTATLEKPELCKKNSAIELTTPAPTNHNAFQQNKYNTIATGYRKVSRANKDSPFNTKNNIRKDYKSPYLYDQVNYYFGFKQFREGNKIISYV